MNNLSTDDIVEIIKFLSITDVIRFTGLNSKFAKAVSENPKVFHGKPTLSMVLGANPEDRFGRNCGILTIQTQKGSFRIIVEPSFPIRQLEISEASKEFMSPFYKLGESKPEHERNHINFFLEWVFRKADLALLENKVNRLAFWVKNAIGLTSCKCFVLAVCDNFDILDTTNVKAQIFLTELCERQKEFEVPITLKIESDTVFLNYICSNDTLSSCRNLFAEVVTDFYSSRFFTALQHFTTMFLQNQLDTESIRIRFDYGSQVIPRPFHENFALPIIQSMQIMFLHPSIEECEDMCEHPRIENLPDYFDLMNNANGDILRYYCHKEGRTVLLTAEVNPL